MKPILFPNMNSTLFSMYRAPLTYYSKSADVVVLKDTKLESDWSFVEKLRQLGIEPHLTSKNSYIEKIKTLINENQYKVIVPTHYDLYQDLFGFDVFSKPEIYKRLSDAGLNTPTLYSSSIAFPVIAKPKSGSGAHGVRKFDNYETLQTFLIEKPYDYIDFGGEYQVEEYIDGPSVNITFFNCNGSPRLISMYDTETDGDDHYLTTQRNYPSVYQPSIQKSLPNLLEFVSMYANKNGILTIDGKIKNGDLYIIDVAHRLPITELSKHLYKNFTLEYVRFMMGDGIEISDLSNNRLLHKYFRFNMLYNGPIPPDPSIKEFERPVEFVKDAWNQNILSRRGFVIIESANAIDKYDETLKFMENHQCTK